MIAGIILSAGRSERMGSPKALLPYLGTTFIGHIQRTAGESDLGQVRVVLGHEPERIIRDAGLDREQVVINPDYDRGMLSSLQEGLRALLPQKPEAVVLFLVDHPDVSTALVNGLIAAFRAGRGQIIIPFHEGRRGHPVLFGARLFDKLLAAPLEQGARAVVRAHPELVFELPVQEGGVLKDIDTPADFEALEQDND